MMEVFHINASAGLLLVTLPTKFEVRSSNRFRDTSI